MTFRDVMDDLPEDARAAGVKLMPGAFACTDIGNCERLVARYRGRIHYCPPRRKWLLWDGRRWRWDETSRIVQYAKATARSIYGEAEACVDAEKRSTLAKHARASESAPRVAAMITLAAAEVPIMPADLDVEPWLLTVSNGTIDLRTGELRPHRREDLITKISPVEYKPEARSDVWDQYLQVATAGNADLVAYLQRSVGYALQGQVTEKSFWFLHGPPDGMKSTFIDAVSGAFGEYHVATSFESWLIQSSTGGNRGDLVRLMGARLVSSVEVRKGARFDESVLKAVTGGDLITAAAKFESEISYLPAFALWLAANDRPIIRDDDEGAWSRVRQVPFTNPLPKDKQDKQMRSKLRDPAARAAILAWAVKGCLAWQKDGIGTCAAVEASTNEYRQDMDRVAGFFDERCAFDVDAWVPTSELRLAYEAWCKENGSKPLSGKDLAARLVGLKCTQGRSNKQRAWKGIRLLSAWEGDGAGDSSDGSDGSSPEPYERNSYNQRSGTAVTAVTAVTGDGSNVEQTPTNGTVGEPEWVLEVELT